MLTGSAPAGRPRWQINIVFVLISTTFIGAISATSGYLVPALAVATKETLGVSAAFIGYQVTLVFGFGGISSLISGGIVGRYGPCRVLQTALAMSAVGSLLYSVPDTRVVTIGSILIGFCYGMSHPAASVLLSRFGSPERMNFLFSFRQTSTALGAVLAGLLGPVLAAILDWQWAFYALAGFSIVIALAMNVVRPHWDDLADPNTAISAPWAGLKLIFRNKPLLGLCVMGFCLSVAQVGVLAFLVLFVVEEVGFTMTQGGFALSLINMLAVGSRIFWGWKADRVRNSLAVVVVMGAVTTVTILVFSMADSEWSKWQVFGIMAVLGLATFGWSGIVIANVVRRAESDKIAETVGGALGFFFSGAWVGPSAGSLILQFTGSYQYVFVFLAITACIATVMAGIAAFRIG
ncbi:MAG: MFS transporter [Rhodobacteraceae bacterium]|nr:MFS transporter [Paracoccaceae bacterium]